MAEVFSLANAKQLGLSGRSSKEIVSGDRGAASTMRLVEIPVPKPGDPARAPHWHPNVEECIHVLSGRAVTWVDGRDHPLEAGDTILIPAREKHVTRNVGDQPLRLLCYFPAPEVTILTDGAS